MTFQPFAQQINKQLGQLQKNRDLFTVSATGDELYAHYLASFPEGSNPQFRERTEHDCSNCKGFIRNFGGVIAIDPETLKVQTIWSVNGLEYPYNVVAARMEDIVLRSAVGGLFRVVQPSFSAERTVSLKDGVTETYNHFFGVAERRFVTQDGAQEGEFQTSVQVLRDSFANLNPGSVQAVLDLIAEKQLYRGEEHQGKVLGFKKAQDRYLSLHPDQRHTYLAVTALDMAVSRFKNSVIGTLVVDLAQGEDVEGAVRSFEAKVAPANYQRTQQVVTQKMVDAALAKIDALGLKVGRRMAHLDDVSVNNVLWVDSSTRPQMKHGLSALLSQAVTTQPVQVSDKAVTEINIDSFLADILPQAQALRLLVAPDLGNSFVTLTTATEEGGPPLFKWGNPFAWSYTGGTTDQIQERVKAAGGNIKALLRFSLSWFNTDDLDLRVEFHQGKLLLELLYYGHKTSIIGGLRGGLDVDMNVHGETRTPVENIAFTSILPGTYRVAVNNFTKREAKDVGFTLQVADGVGTTDYHYPLAVSNGQTIEALTATVDSQGNVTYVISPALQKASTQVTGEKWGLPYGQYAEVGSVLLSPNHWDGQSSGNKHTFFILKEAKADEQPRGIYNEYLHPDLHVHRKVFDVIGEKTKPELTDDQLSGIGVSSTLSRQVVVEVSAPGSRRNYRVQF